MAQSCFVFCSATEHENTIYQTRLGAHVLKRYLQERHPGGIAPGPKESRRKLYDKVRLPKLERQPCSNIQCKNHCGDHNHYCLSAIDKNMQVNFDKSADALYIKLKRGRVKKTFARGDNFIVDLDSKGNILGFEILQYSKIIATGKKQLAVPV